MQFNYQICKKIKRRWKVSYLLLPCQNCALTRQTIASAMIGPREKEYFSRLNTCTYLQFLKERMISCSFPYTQEEAMTCFPKTSQNMIWKAGNSPRYLSHRVQCKQHSLQLDMSCLMFATTLLIKQWQSSLISLIRGKVSREVTPVFC